MKKSLALAFLLAAISGCASTGPQHLQTSDTRQCAQNFTFEGSFLTGKTYKTHDLISGVSKKTAIERAAKYTLNDGWKVTNIDQDLGIISASQDVSFGNGKTAPLNISVDETSNGIKVSMSFATSGGVSAPTESVKDHFCATIQAVKG